LFTFFKSYFFQVTLITSGNLIRENQGNFCELWYSADRPMRYHAFELKDGIFSFQKHFLMSTWSWKNYFLKKSNSTAETKSSHFWIIK